MSEKSRKLFRVNANISVDLNAWLDEESARTGHTKSTLIMLAVETYKQQKTAQTQVVELSQLIARLERLDAKPGDDEQE